MVVEPSSCLVVLVSRKAIEHSDSISITRTLLTNSAYLPSLLQQWSPKKTVALFVYIYWDAVFLSCGLYVSRSWKVTAS